MILASLSFIKTFSVAGKYIAYIFLYSIIFYYTLYYKHRHLHLLSCSEENMLAWKYIAYFVFYSLTKDFVKYIFINNYCVIYWLLCFNSSFLCLIYLLIILAYKYFGENQLVYFLANAEFKYQLHFHWLVTHLLYRTSPFILMK